MLDSNSGSLSIPIFDPMVNSVVVEEIDEVETEPRVSKELSELIVLVYPIVITHVLQILPGVVSIILSATYTRRIRNNTWMLLHSQPW